MNYGYLNYRLHAVELSGRDPTTPLHKKIGLHKFLMSYSLTIVVLECILLMTFNSLYVDYWIQECIIFLVQLILIGEYVWIYRPRDNNEILIKEGDSGEAERNEIVLDEPENIVQESGIHVLTPETPFSQQSNLMRSDQGQEAAPVEPQSTDNLQTHLANKTDESV